MVDSGYTSHMTGSKEIMTELRPNLNNSSVSYGDKSKAEVKSLGKVVVARDITLVNVMLVESLGYNLMSVRALNKMNFDVHFTIDMVVLLRSGGSRLIVPETIACTSHVSWQPQEEGMMSAAVSFPSV